MPDRVHDYLSDLERHGARPEEAAEVGAHLAQTAEAWREAGEAEPDAAAVRTLGPARRLARALVESRGGTPRLVLGTALVAVQVVMTTVCVFGYPDLLPYGLVVWAFCTGAAGWMLGEAAQRRGAVDLRALLLLPVAWVLGCALAAPFLDVKSGFLTSDTDIRRDIAQMRAWGYDDAVAHYERKLAQPPAGFAATFRKTLETSSTPALISVVTVILPQLFAWAIGRKRRV